MCERCVSGVRGKACERKLGRLDQSGMVRVERAVVEGKAGVGQGKGRGEGVVLRGGVWEARFEEGV